MESSSSPSANSSELPANRWAEILGTMIAILTLALPVFAIANFSSSNSLIVQQTSYTLPNSGN